MSDIKTIREALKIDDEDFQIASAAAQNKFKALILTLMADAQDDTDKSAIMGGLCAAFVSGMILFKPDDMTAQEVVESVAHSVWITGMQMLEFDEETLVTLRKNKE